MAIRKEASAICHSRTILFLSSLLTLLLTGCGDLRHTLSWKTQPFVRVPAPLPKGWDEKAAHGIVEGRNWYFKHVVTCPSKKTPEAHWWMAWPKDEKKLKLGNATWFKMLTTGTAIRISDWKKIAAVTPEIAEECRAIFHAYPQMVQPELIFKPSSVEAENRRIQTAHEAMENYHCDVTSLELGALPKGGWAKGASDAPPYDPLWHQRAAYSQLEDAKKIVRASTGAAGGGIRVGILDSGFNHHQLLVPKNTLGSNGKPGNDRAGEPRGDAINSLACANGTCSEILPGETNGAHGMKAMSILAGGRLTLRDPLSGKRGKNVIDEKYAREGIELGGAPDATIVPARVAPWVFSHSTANLAYAIDYASRVQKCDVISMSHGGTPSAMWIDAVNAAYDRGTAIFAACADYYNLPPIDLGIVLPSATVYPAACRRVQAVAGVSANGTPYGTSDMKHYPFYFLAPWHWFHLRGTFGADGAHRDVWHTSLTSMNKRTDKSQRERGGLLRAQPISTFTPNVASAQPPDKKHEYKTNVLNLDWDGTSAATPQAAAAAALWLAQHKKEIQAAGHWDDWQKAEAVFVAMLKSAGGNMPGQSATPLASRLPDLYCGAGSLKAADMLKVSFDDARKTQVPGKLQFPQDKNGMHRDFYDGQRSGAAILGFETRFAPYRQRADALIGRDHIVTDEEQKQAALIIIFYNQRLVQQWNIGRLPRRDVTDTPEQAARARCEGDSLLKRKGWLTRYFSPDDADLRKEAADLAARATARR